MIDDENKPGPGIRSYAERLKNLPGPNGDGARMAAGGLTVGAAANRQTSANPAGAAPVTQRGLTVSPNGTGAGASAALGGLSEVNPFNIAKTSQPGSSKVTGAGLSSPLYTNERDAGLAVAAPGQRMTSTDAAIAAVPSLGNAPVSRSEPSGGALSGPAGGITVDPKSQNIHSGLSGLSGIDPAIVRGQSQQPGREATGIISADNKAMAAANAIRQQMINAQPKGGAAALRDSAADAWNARMERDGQVQKITDLMARNPNMAGALSGALSHTVAGQSQQEVEQIRQRNNAGIEMARLGLTARGQDINYASTIAQQGLTARELDLTAQNQKSANELSAIRTGIDVERLGLDKQAAQRQQAASDALAQANATGDPTKIAQARQAAILAGLKVEPAPSLQHVETERGAMVFDPRTGRMTPATGPDGVPVGSGKALTEFQGKSTGFGMRADAASRVIDQVGQDGKVQPSLIKRTVEAVPLIGEGLGMVANRFASPEQQQVEQAQRDFVNAVLRQESGAAISATEFDNARKQYFPQPNDSPEVIEQKQRNREMAINGFRVSAGPGARNIGGAPAPAAQQAPAQQSAAAPAVGTVDGGYVFLGGNPNDQANWMEVRK